MDCPYPSPNLIPIKMKWVQFEMDSLCKEIPTYLAAKEMLRFTFSTVRYYYFLLYK